MLKEGERFTSERHKALSVTVLNWRHAALRSIAALALREMATRYGRTPGGYVWAVLQPLGMIVLLAFAFSLLQKHPALGTSFLMFKATGVLIVRQVMSLSTVTGYALSYSRSLLLYPRVSWLDAVLARFLLNMVVLCAVMTLIFGAIMLFEGWHIPPDWLWVIVTIAMAGLLGLSVGLLNCYLFHRFEVWGQIWGILTTPLFLVSGVILLFEDMPSAAQQVLWFNPVLHLTGMMRAAFYPTYTPTYISLAYLGIWCLVPMWLGLALMRRDHRSLIARK